jgi:hypothetical protein
MEVPGIEMSEGMSGSRNEPWFTLQLDGNEVVSVGGEHKPEVFYYFTKRLKSFSQLEEFGFVPNQLIELAKYGKTDKLVKLVLRRVRGTPGYRLRMKELDSHDLWELRVGMREQMSASAALALILRVMLQQLTNAQRAHAGSPVRAMGLAPKSLIGEIAMYLLNDCRCSNKPPPEQLTKLFAELLSSGGEEAAEREFKARHRAASILAGAPHTKTRKLARMVDVNAGTISRWRRNKNFQSLIKRYVESRKSVSRAFGDTDLDNVVVIEGM